MQNQDFIQEWRANLPSEILKQKKFLEASVVKFNTFDLLSYISYYNHLHNIDVYSDYRGDKHFVVPEVLTLLCLKKPFIEKSLVSQEEFILLSKEIQEATLKYFGHIDALDMNNNKENNSIESDIADTLEREAKVIRNPGHPEHHYIFSQKIFEPINNEIIRVFGFSIIHSIKLRKEFPKFINSRYKKATDEANAKAKKYANEILKFKKNKVISEFSYYSLDELEEYSLLSDNEIKKGLEIYFINELYYNFSNIYTFTASDLAVFLDIEIQSIEIFLKTFSCGFPSLNEEDEIYTAISILKKKPFIVHNNRYLLPSLPLLTWAVEDFIFDEFYSKNKFQLPFKIDEIRHTFLLNESFKYFENLLKTSSFFYKNLIYYNSNNRYETDGLILYDRVLFIIEAKGHRITERAKKGYKDRTKKHLKEIFGDSYSQGIRTLDYINENSSAVFKPQKGNSITIRNSDFDDVVIVSLTLEPIGNLSMVLKYTKEINYFKEGHFPWIISIYDLVIINDLIENPILLVHYIKRRKKFLSVNELTTYEELDLISYFLANGLYTEHYIKEINDNKYNYVYFPCNTDEINDYYMYRFGHKRKYTNKPKINIPAQLNFFLNQLDKSMLPHRVRMALLLLEFNADSIEQLMSYIKKNKKKFSQDKSLHDCSIYTHSYEGLGVTFMNALKKSDLDFNLYKYCTYKMHQMNSNAWVGFGDISTNPKTYDFKSFYLVMKKNIEEIDELKV
jgi:hypothetical protein